MSIATVVTRGFGSFGSVNLLPTWGYGITIAAISPFCFEAVSIVSGGVLALNIAQPGSIASNVAHGGSVVDSIDSGGDDASLIVQPGSDATSIGCC